MKAYYTTIKKNLQNFLNDSLCKNSIFLMANTFVAAVFGFFFWIINARLFPAEQIGLATTLISVMSLIISLSLMGLDAGLIRYLPKAKRKNDQINSCFFVTSLVAIIVSLLFLLGLKTFSPKLLFIRKNFFISFLFVLFMVFGTAASLIDSVFIAFRKTEFVLIKSTVFSTLKLVFPYFLIALGAFGIFSSWVIALTISLGVSFAILKRRFSYQPVPSFQVGIIKKISRFSFGNYIAGFFNSLPTILLPLMVTNLVNPRITAYYYMAMMVANFLFVIPQAATQSLFAEGSYNEKELWQQVEKAIKIIILILTPAILITIFFGKYILLAFEKDYSKEGFRFLQLLALSGGFVSLNAVFSTVLKVKHEVKKLILANFFGALSILGISWFLVSRSLSALGVAWLIGQGITSGIYLLFFRKYFNQIKWGFRQKAILSFLLESQTNKLS